VSRFNEITLKDDAAKVFWVDNEAGHFVISRTGSVVVSRTGKLWIGRSEGRAE
jgi:hypothetical protein